MHSDGRKAPKAMVKSDTSTRQLIFNVLAGATISLSIAALVCSMAA